MQIVSAILIFDFGVVSTMWYYVLYLDTDLDVYTITVYFDQSNTVVWDWLSECELKTLILTYYKGLSSSVQ